MKTKLERNNRKHLLLQLTNACSGLYEAASSPVQSMELVLLLHACTASLFYIEKVRNEMKIEEDNYYNAPWEIRARQKAAEMVEKGAFPGYFDVELAK
jgi:hypothetical protein